ncbi:MAG: hypothetical protein WBC44_02660 [Planctomycetaceae bacterium]
MPSIFSQVLDATRDVIVGLGLSDMPAERIVLMPTVPRATDQVVQTLPAIVLAPLGAETINHATNLSDDITYPIAVVILDSAENKPLDATAADLRLTWRESILRAFHNKRMSAVTGITTQAVQPLEAVSAAGWAQGYFVSALVIRVTVRKARS